MGDEFRVGVDLGGTKTEAVVLRVATGSHAEAFAAPDVVARERIATPRDEGYDAIVARTAALVRDVIARVGAPPAVANLADGTLPIGVGMPGATTMRRPDGTPSDVPIVKNSNTTCLNGRPFHADLERALGAPIAFANDANCFALAEATWGSARGGRVVFGVIMGTGVGGGIVICDAFAPSGIARTWDGAQGIAGEWGHVVLTPGEGPACYCGRRGCIETYLSGPAIERAYAERTGQALPLAMIAERARVSDDGSAPHDTVAGALLHERLELFGRALATVINVLDPDVVVLGGGVSNLDALYTEGRTAVAREIFNDALETPIVKHALGDSAGVFGAALLRTR